MRSDHFCTVCYEPVRHCLNELGQDVYVNPVAHPHGQVYVLDYVHGTPIVRSPAPDSEPLRYLIHPCIVPPPPVTDPQPPIR